MDKRIITAAVTGSIHTPSMSPYLPITPDQIVEETVRSYNAGAAVVHIHARDPKTGQPSADVPLYQEIAAKIKSRCNIVQCITTGAGTGKTGGWMTTEQRLTTIRTLKPELASLNFGSINFALFPVLDRYKEFKFPWEKEYLTMTEDLIFPNTFKSLKEFVQTFQANNTQPELEIYDVGMINNVAFMMNRGDLRRPIYIQFVMGVLGGIPPSPDNLLFMYNTAKRLLGDFTWSVIIAGREQFNMGTMSLIMGGNVRVGLEDNLYLDRGVKAKSNAEQVEKIIRIAKELGIEPATPDETRKMLGLKGLDKVAY
jgi:uncharacterized protein (DUF849 family)